MLLGIYNFSEKNREEISQMTLLDILVINNYNNWGNTTRVFCECCGMRLRASPAAWLYKEKVRAKKKLIAAIWFVCEKSLGRQ